MLSLGWYVRRREYSNNGWDWLLLNDVISELIGEVGLQGIVGTNVGCCCDKNVDKSLNYFWVFGIVGTYVGYCCDKNVGKSSNFNNEVGFEVLLKQMLDVVVTKMWIRV